MRVVEQGPDRLVLEVRPVALMVMCAGLFLLFFVLGFGMRLFIPFLAGLAGVGEVPGLSAIPAVPGMNLLGYASVIPLLVAVFLLKTRRLALDRKAGTVTLAARGAFGRSEQVWPLADFRGANLARNRSAGNNSTTYTPMLQFADKSVPVYPYGTSGSGPARLVQTVNDWLGPADSGESVTTLSGDQAAAVLAALEQAGIRVPR